MSLGVTQIETEERFGEPERVSMVDLERFPLRQCLHAVRLAENCVIGEWGDGRNSRFHAVWLRDNCACEVCRHDKTMERTFLLIDAEPPILSAARTLPGGHLEVEFVDGHRARFDAGWLRARAYDDWAQREDTGAPSEWGSEFSVPRFAYDEVVASEQGLTAWLEALIDSGIAIVEGAPAKPETMLEIVRRVQEPRTTNFGQIFDVRSLPNPNSSAYTALGLECHADLVNWGFPPDFQVLFCIENGAEGGESVFVNAMKATATLRSESLAAFDLLARIPVEYRFHDGECDIRHVAPVIELGTDGVIRRLRFNNWIRNRPLARSDEMEVWYAAYMKLWAIIRDKRHQLRLRLAPGEMVVFDNVRVLHGRTAFDPQSGPRHLRGCYMDRDWIQSRIRLAQRAIR